MLNTGGNLKVNSHRVCVIYDGASGRVLHVHHDVSLQGVPQPTENEVEAAALAQLHKRGRVAGQLRALHVNPNDLQPLVRYRVDLQRQVLQRLPIK